jgi:hypothetical protein
VCVCVSESANIPDLLQALKVVTELGVQVGRGELTVLAISVVLLSVQEPLGDLELEWVLDDGNKLLSLVSRELTSTKEREKQSKYARQQVTE